MERSGYGMLGAGKENVIYRDVLLFPRNGELLTDIIT